MIRFICKSYLNFPWMIKMKVFHPSLDRLAELADSAAREPAAPGSLSAEFSHILHDLSIRGVWRWTGRHRLRGMDRLLSEYARARGWERLRMLDVGASDGITAFDTFEHMKRENRIPVSITVVDRHVRLFSIKRKATTLYFTSSRRPTLLRCARFALCLEAMEGIEGIVFNRLASRLARRYAGTLERLDLRAARPISLVNPAVARCPALVVCERDLFDPEPAWFGQYDAVRASNVLNLSYYSEAKIREAIGVLHGYLKESGALLMSRNLMGGSGEKEIGGLWRKDAAGFTLVSSLEALPEIAGIVDQFRAPERDH